MNKKLEETKEFFKVFEWPSGNKLSTSIISKISDNNLMKLRKSMKETFPSEYEKAMKKIPDDKKVKTSSEYREAMDVFDTSDSVSVKPTLEENMASKSSYSVHTNSSLYDKQDLYKAYKFLTYLDTTTRKGYDVSHLSDDEVMGLYLDIKNNYPSEYNKVMKKIKNEIKPRTIVIPDHSILSTKRKKSEVEAVDEEKDKEDALNSLYQDNDKELDNDSSKLDNDSSELNNDDNELGNDGDNLDDIDLSRFGIENNNDKENSQPMEVKDKRSIMPNNLKKLVDKFKNDKKFRRKVLIGAAALAIVAGVAIYTAVTGDNSLSQNIDVNSFASNSNGINLTNTPADEFVKATIQNYDPNVLASASNVDLSSVNLGDISFGLDGLDQIYSNAADAANLSGGLTPDVSAGNVSLADLYNNATGEWMNIDPSSLSIDELKELVSSGDYSVAYTNDPSLIGQGGETLANSNLITGFDNAEHYIDMVEEATKSAGGRTL